MSEPSPTDQPRMRPRLRAARRHSGELRMVLGAVVAGWITFRVILAIQDSHAWWRIGMGIVAVVAGLVLVVDGYRIRARARGRAQGRRKASTAADDAGSP